MKKAAMFLAGAFFALTAAAQEKKEIITGSGENTKVKREISGDFNIVKVTGNFDVVLGRGETGTMTLEGDRNLLSFIITEVKDGALTIATQQGKHLAIGHNQKITIKVPVKQLSEVSLKGCGTIKVKDRVRNTSVKLLLDGAGAIDVAVDCQNVTACVLGSGGISVRGKTENFDCKVVGSGIIKAYGLNSPNVEAVVSGAGNVEANSTKKIKGRISGPGNIAFDGQPADTDLKHSGTGQFSYANTDYR